VDVPQLLEVGADDLLRDARPLVDVAGGEQLRRMLADVLHLQRGKVPGAYFPELNAVPGISIPEEGIERRPNVPLQGLTAPGALERFLESLDWVVDEIRLDPAST
jgi:hypothetical protein